MNKKIKQEKDEFQKASSWRQGQGAPRERNFKFLQNVGHQTPGRRLFLIHCFGGHWVRKLFRSVGQGAV